MTLRVPGRVQSLWPDKRSVSRCQDNAEEVVIPAKAGLRRQDAGANIRAANGPKGASQEQRVIQLFDKWLKKLDPGFHRDDEPKFFSVVLGRTHAS